MCIIFPRSSTICFSGTILTPSIISSLLRADLPAQRAVEKLVLQQVAQPFKSREPSIDQVFMFQAEGLEAAADLPRPLLRRPVKFKARKHARKFGEICLVGALVRPRLGSYCDGAAGNGLSCNFRELEDPAIQIVGTGVERLIVDVRGRGFQDGHES